MGADHVCTGDIHINRCEFFANGAGLYAHQMYLCSYRPGAQAIVEHCYIHDATGGANLKTRMPRNLIRYNWLENAASYAVDMVDADKCNGITEGGDFYGNVVLAAENYTTKQLVHLGSDQDCSPGNRGRFRLTHNLFVTVSTMTRVINVHGIVGEVALYNNIFLGRRERFAAAVGAGGWPLDTQIGRIVARNNWIHPGALECYIDNDVPPVALDFTGTLPDRADEPIDRPGATTLAGLCDLAQNDLHLRPRAGSPCAAGADAGSPCLPAYEPVRAFLGIQGKPPRRSDAAAIRALGPFSPEE
jgi:hypothetical protein